MIDELENQLSDFAGPANRTRCFLHIVNLVARSILRMFEAPKKKKSDANVGMAEGTTDDLVEKLVLLASDLELDGLEENEAAVEALARGMDVEESVTRASLDAGEANNDQQRDGDDDVDGLVDLTALLAGDNLRRLKAGALPVRKVLVKASLYLQYSDPIRWWKSNARTYPKLHRMAIDYLCIPGASSLAA
jgi:hypothetical protein